MSRSMFQAEMRLRRASGRSIESLESRLLMAANSWNTDSSGFWNVVSNWSAGRVQEFGEDVVIDRGDANPVITITQNDAITVRKLTAKEFIQVNGAGALRTFYQSEFSGGLQVLDGNLFLDNTTVSGDLQFVKGTIFSYNLNATGSVSFTGNDQKVVSGVWTLAGNASMDGGETLLRGRVNVTSTLSVGPAAKFTYDDG